jgi:hypothetical protein
MTTTAKGATAMTTHEHAAEVDTRIADLYVAWTKAQGYEGARADTVRYAAGQRHEYVTRTERRWTGELADAEAKLLADANSYAHSHGKTKGDIYLELKAAREATLAAGHAYVQAEGEYEGWSRFFLVQGGHIHSSMGCSTCNHRGRRTSFGWLPELSGLTEAEAVEAHGPVLCTVCFPSAPVEWTLGSLNDKGEYVAPKTYCAGSGTSEYVEGSARTNYAGTTVTCSHCSSRVKYGNSGLRKHQAPKS